MRRGIVGAALAVALAVPAVASADQATYAGYPVVSVNVNGTVLQPDVPAIVVNGRTLLPLRAVAEALSADVQWNQTTETATVHAAQTVGYVDQPVSNPGQPMDGKSYLCAVMSSDVGKVTASTAQTWAANRSSVVQTELFAFRYPDDNPDALWAERWAAIVPLYVTAEDDLYVAATDPDSTKKQAAGKYLMVQATDQLFQFEKDYAAGPGKGNDPCGEPPQPHGDPWLSVN